MVKTRLSIKKSIFLVCFLMVLLFVAFSVTIISSKAAEKSITNGDLSYGRSFKSEENLV